MPGPQAREERHALSRSWTRYPDNSPRNTNALPLISLLSIEYLSHHEEDSILPWKKIYRLCPRAIIAHGLIRAPEYKRGSSHAVTVMIPSVQP